MTDTPDRTFLPPGLDLGDDAAAALGVRVNRAKLGLIVLAVGLSVLAVAFTGYLAVGALLWTTPPANPMVQLVAVACYLVTTWLCIFWKAQRTAGADPITGELGRGALLPAWAAVLALAAAVLVPNASWVAAGPEAAM